MATEPATFDGYVRVSRRLGRQGPAYISPKVQRDAIQRWADYRNVKILAWHIDEDESGGTQNRPGLREAMTRIETKQTGGIACWRLNRFARNVSDAIRDVKRIQAAGAQLALIEEGIDPTGPFGMFLLTVLLAVATLERDNAVAGFEEAKRRAVNRGAYISRTPFGYQRNPDGTLSPHPEYAPVVTETFRLAATRDLRATQNYLEQVAPFRNWTPTKVRRLIAGRSYLGETRNGTIIAEGTHQPLVDRRVWQAAQSSPRPRKSAEHFPLSGLLRCGTCGNPMVGSRGGAKQRTYRCHATLQLYAADACPRGATITASIIEDHAREKARELLQGWRVTVSDPDAATLTLLEHAVTEAETELDAFAGDMTLRRALGDRYHAHLDARAAAVEQARIAYRQHAKEAQTALTLMAPDVLEREDLFGIALRSLFSAIVITPGRGMTVEQRSRFIPLGSDRPSGVSGSKGS